METIAAYSGGGLPAAIGIVRLSGERAGEILDRIFRGKDGNPITNRNNKTLYYGKLLAKDGMALDFCMAAFFRGPHSYTGEDMAEVYCHGSQAVVSAALEHAYALGARPAQAGEFTKRAFLAGKLDLCEVEAVADLIHSRSERAAKNAAAALEGAIGGQVAAMRQQVLGLLSHYYAVCDYPDEDIDPFAYQQAAQVLEQAGCKATALYNGYRRGSVIKDGVPVAIIGRPNAGKSSLFNALSGYERAIVTDEAGTTRDVIEETISVGGALLRILDTAGIRQGQGKAEQIGIEKALETARRAALVLCVVDGSRPLGDDDRRVLDAGAGKTRALVLNKEDRGLCLGPEDFAGFDRVFALSAKTGQGVDALAQWLSAQAPDNQEALISSPRQAELLRRAAEDLRSAAQAARAGMTADAFLADAERAARTLGEITGQDTGADMVQGIFDRFCVGK